MCWFITVAVSAKMEPAFHARAHAAALETSQQENASISSFLATLDRGPPDARLWTVTTGGCSCDLVTTAPVDRRLRGHERRQRLAGAAIAGVAVRRDVRELLASVAELGRPVAIVIHTYGGTLDERFTLTAGARWTPDEMRSNDTHFTPDTTCIVRVIAGYHRSS